MLRLADDMGLGKRLQSLAIASYYKNKWPLLILTTKSGVSSWKHQIEHWLSTALREQLGLDDKAPIVDYIQTIESTTDVQYDLKSRIVICRYGVMSKCVKELVKFPHDMVILDQSHCLKNKRAKRTKAAMFLVRESAHLLLLSGTPALSRPDELFTQISMLHPHLFDSSIQFERRYCDGFQQQRLNGVKFWTSKGLSYARELRLLLQEFILFRRDKSDFQHEFPQKNRRIVQIDLSVTDRRFIKWHNHCMKNKAETIPKTYFHITCEEKVPAVCEYVCRLLQDEAQGKFIVYTQHKMMRDGLEQMCQRIQSSCIRIDGATTDMQDQLFKFENDENVKIAILSMHSVSGLEFSSKF